MPQKSIFATVLMSLMKTIATVGISLLWLEIWLNVLLPCLTPYLGWHLNDLLTINVSLDFIKFQILND